jgi:iron(III) transport system substrate-binding protein
MKIRLLIKTAQAGCLIPGLVILLAGIAFAATDDVLVERAKREGEVVYYASMNLSEANALIEEFEKRYPFIKVKLNRTGSEKLLTKVMAEHRAQKLSADVIQTVEFSMHLFGRRGVLAHYVPPENAQFPSAFKEEGFWTTVYYNPYVIAYNTRFVQPVASPKTYEDLLDPKWKGKMQIMGQERGLKYMRDLARQHLSPREGHELLAQLVAAGEGQIDVNIPIASVERMKEKGAPIDWTSGGPAPAIMVGIGISAQAEHPNAAKLYTNFVLSREGQKLMKTPGRLVAREDLEREQSDLKKKVKMVPVDPSLAEKLGDYAKQLRSIFGS